MRIYLFNVTNAAEWMSGKDRKIRVQQIGPYIYRENWTKTNITFHR
jgi:scavenger receptor class B protein 1